MAQVLAPLNLQKTMGNLTFYKWDGAYFVRKKSSLTRRKVLYAPTFARTRQFAGLMGIASKIASGVYDSLPVSWRQGWMYRSFTGEAFTMLKEGKQEREIKQLLWERYVKEVAEKQVTVSNITAPAKRAYRKKDAAYWKHKTTESQKRRARKERIQRNGKILAQASTIASRMYQQVPLHERSRVFYQRLTGWAMKALKESKETIKAPCINHRNRWLYFLPRGYKRIGVTGITDIVDPYWRIRHHTEWPDFL